MTNEKNKKSTTFLTILLYEKEFLFFFYFQRKSEEERIFFFLLWEGNWPWKEIIFFLSCNFFSFSFLRKERKKKEEQKIFLCLFSYTFLFFFASWCANIKLLCAHTPWRKEKCSTKRLNRIAFFYLKKRAGGLKSVSSFYFLLNYQIGLKI